MLTSVFSHDSLDIRDMFNNSKKFLKHLVKLVFLDNNKLFGFVWLKALIPDVKLQSSYFQSVVFGVTGKIRSSNGIRPTVPFGGKKTEN